MTPPIAIVVGFIGKNPVAGMALYNLHYIAGLQSLGYDVHYVERLNQADECYDPSTNSTTDDPTYALVYVEKMLGDLRISSGRWSFVDRKDVCHGSGWPALRLALDQADFVLDLADATWFDELERCDRRAFLDGDPLFTQVAMLDGDGRRAGVLSHYDTLFTIGARMGASDCTIPEAGREWIRTRSVVATNMWKTAPPRPGPITTVMNWAAWGDVEFDGHHYGHKNREFERFIDLPARSRARFSVAIGGPAPKARLRDHGWGLVDPLAVTATFAAYREFIAGSRADFGLAKHAYVASRSGWFSDRSLCYLASGRPVLHQDTGFTDWLPSSDGVFPFSTVGDVIESLERLEVDYDKHARAARVVAEEHFEAATIVGHMLDAGGLR
jgi:hypothetical protein